MGDVRIQQRAMLDEHDDAGWGSTAHCTLMNDDVHLESKQKQCAMVCGERMYI